MSIRLVKTPFSAPSYRDSKARGLYSVDMNVPTAQQEASSASTKPNGPRKTYTGFKGGVLSSSSPQSTSQSPTVSPLNEPSPAPPAKRPFTRSRASPYADAYPSKTMNAGRVTRASTRRLQAVFETVQEEEEPTKEDHSDFETSFTLDRRPPNGSLYKPLPSGWSVAKGQGCSDYSKQVAGMLLSRVGDGRVPRSSIRGRKSYVKSGLSRVSLGP